MAELRSCTEQETMDWCMLLKQLRLTVVVDSSSQRDHFVEDGLHCAPMRIHILAIDSE